MAFFIILLGGLAWSGIAVSRGGLKKLSWTMWLVMMLGLIGTVKWVTGGL